jgi:hypothetical protein
MMLVHVWPGASKVLSADVPLPLLLFYRILILEFGQASVPLLSIVSGFLLYRSLGNNPWLTLLKSKVRTLLVPMAIWSALLLTVFAVKEWFLGNDDFFAVGLMEWINRVFAVTGPPINLPLAFLRDIFVCCAIAATSSRLEKSVRWSGHLMVVVFAIAELSFAGILLLRPQIMIFFFLGYAIAESSPRSLVIPWAVVIGAVLVDALIQLGFIEGFKRSNDFQALFHRLAVAFLMWRIAITIARRDGYMFQFLERLEPVIFLVFCSHMFTVSAMAACFTAGGLQVTDPIYPLVFILQIPAIYLGAVMIRAVGETISPRFMDLALASKLPKTGQRRNN